ncbi:histidine phosphatase family protein [Ottowia sp.]|uniref:SixA phosphatase family protein n=1 Tax=Ottowia sp. TaxID=1898956 RepID=UPI002BDD0E33|nr:histidine phosphatase family protein [Ottowia sp.]HRN74231.1 histidine phosphatase family protein [Ottowia sp.]HRQ01409.1 histidine phosphatase family protein [Ottowia sp.]
MDLILWRHAEAQEPEGDMSDMDRQLTRRGDKQAMRMAAWLDRQLPEGTRILCSPAIRTEQTVLALGRKYKLHDELRPGASPEQLLQLADWPSAKAPVLIVGHQPTLGETIARLLGMAEGECSVKKGSVWWLRSRERDGQLQTVVLTVQVADLL